MKEMERREVIFPKKPIPDGSSSIMPGMLFMARHQSSVLPPRTPLRSSKNEENDNEKQNGVRTRDCRATDGTYQQTDRQRESDDGFISHTVQRTRLDEVSPIFVNSKNPKMTEVLPRSRE